MNFSECLTVKIAHDLAGGIGALSSTVDLMNIDPTFVSEAPEMLKSNTNMLMDRLKFYRALFGAETKSIDSTLVQNYLKTLGPKIQFKGDIQNRLELSLVALGIQMVAAGGDIIYSNNTLTMSSNKLIFKDNVSDILNGKLPQSSEVDTIEAEWVMIQLKSQKLKLQLKKAGAKIELKVV